MAIYLQDTIFQWKYNYWIARMKIHLESINLSWNMVEKGYELPLQWKGLNFLSLRDDTKQDTLNAKAINTLVCALGPKEFNGVSNCETTKGIWDTKKVTHEGTN